MKPRRLTLALAGLGLWAGLGEAAQPPAGPELTPPPVRVETVPPPVAVQHIPAPVVVDGLHPEVMPVVPGVAKGYSGGHRWGGNPPPAGPSTQVGPPTYVPPQYPTVQQQYGRRPFRNLAQFLGVGCWSHHSADVPCGSLRSELTFIFGSCRAFFLEPCRPGPPAAPLPVNGPGPGHAHGRAYGH